jgi:hypothetical protein
MANGAQFSVPSRHRIGHTRFCEWRFENILLGCFYSMPIKSSFIDVDCWNNSKICYAVENQHDIEAVFIACKTIFVVNLGHQRNCEAF